MNTQNFSHIRHLSQLLGELEGTYHEISVKMGISDSVCKILYTFCCFGACCPLNDICRYTGLSKQTVHSALRNLEEKGCLYLKALDGKSKKACLTDEGIALANRTALQIMELENDILASWSREERDLYIELTERFLTSLKEKVPQL